MAKRVRRTPEEARRVILDAAEASLARSGPAGVRLQEVAKAAGVSHPTILHHFTSREGLIQALNERTLAQLRTVVIQAMEPSDATSGGAVSAAFAAYRNGLAQRILWMMQAPGEAGPRRLALFDDLVDVLHALRLKNAPPGSAVDRYDSVAIVHLTTVAAFGDALMGARLRRAATEAEELEGQKRFEAWLGALLNAHIAGANAPPRSEGGSVQP